MNINHYAYRVIWSEEDNEHIGLCTEFPSLSWLAPSAIDALIGIQQIISEVVADMKDNGEPLPEPLSKKHYSGNLRIRIPPQAHRTLAIEAAEQGVSLNRLVSSKLAA